MKMKVVSCDCFVLFFLLLILLLLMTVKIYLCGNLSTV